MTRNARAFTMCLSAAGLMLAFTGGHLFAQLQQPQPQQPQSFEAGDDVGGGRGRQ